MMNILISNDDGIFSPGIIKLAEVASKFGKVWVAAPGEQCSGMSHKLTIFHPISVEEVDFPVPVECAWKIGGTPADCVKIAITALMPVKPDFVFSGINKGYNCGFDIAYSGTIGAAMEGLLNDVPAIAFSNAMGFGFDVIDVHLPSIIEEFLSQPTSLQEIWNVNFPGCAPENVKGIQRDLSIAPMCLFECSYKKLASETGTDAMHPDGTKTTPDRVPVGTDLHAVFDGFIAIGKVRSAVK